MIGETQIKSKSAKEAHLFCCTARTGLHVLYIELSSSVPSFCKRGTEFEY
jgi:hypothetical protein